jgi:hypothetical protein
MYHHTQIGHVTRLAALAGGVAAVWAMVVVGAPPFVWPLLAVLLLAGFAFGSLTIEVSHDRLTFWFGPGILRRSFALAEIDSCAAVTNPWWYGWGIHLTPRGWLYNVAGRRAVELALRDGRTLRIGTDEPEQLCQVITTLKG